jgi:hypothetical protein
MLDILAELVPGDCRITPKLYLHYLKTLKDKMYKVRLPDVSPYEIQVQKSVNKIVIVNHQYYKTHISNFTFSQVENAINEMFEKEKKKRLADAEQFIMDLRF